MENNLKITPISDLVKFTSGSLVELPPFNEGQPFVAKLKRPSLMNLIKLGKIPNALLTSANSLFEKGPAGILKEDVDFDDPAMNKLFDLIDIICEAAFVEPSYKEIREAGIELTDEQFLFVFDYTQNGVKSLESFRK